MNNMPGIYYCRYNALRKWYIVFNGIRYYVNSYFYLDDNGLIVFPIRNAIVHRIGYDYYIDPMEKITTVPAVDVTNGIVMNTIVPIEKNEN